jgi:SAM-dependent methyltransferase
MNIKTALTTVCVIAVVVALGFAQGAAVQAEVASPVVVPLPLRAADIFALQARCAAAEPQEQSYQLARRCAFGGTKPDEVKIVAFEENQFFIHAVAEVLRGESKKERSAEEKACRLVRRFVFLKPSTFLVDDCMTAPASSADLRWWLISEGPPEITGAHVRIAGSDATLFCETLLPGKVTHETARLTYSSNEMPDLRREEHHTAVVPQGATAPDRFLHLLQVDGAGQKECRASAKLVGEEDGLELTVRAPDRVFRLSLPPAAEGAGEIEVAKADGATLFARRLLPSGVLPHGPEGVRLLERWDNRYRGERRPGWDTGRPSSELKKAVEEGTLRPCRAVVLGCGSGTNAVYLASQGFDVTAIDIAPSALGQGIDKAKKADVRVRWMLADVLAPPELAPFDLIFDRGCYHGVRRQNAAGYVEAVRRLSRPGTRVLILAGNANDPNPRGGPPRVKEEEIRGDFASSFEFEWLRETRFDTRDPKGEGALAWSILLRRREER